MHELDNMDASASGNPWYPLECIVVLSPSDVVAALCRSSAVFEVRRNIVYCHISWCEWSRGMFAYVGRSEDSGVLWSSQGVMHAS